MSSTMTTPSLPNTTLFYIEGASSKTYQLQIVGEEATGFRVNFQYGRIGGTLQSGTKTKSPVTFDTAKTIFDNLVKEKQAKGYTPNIDGTPYQGCENNGKDFGAKPQLLNFIEENEVEKYINDDAWVCQEKKDGCRVMVKKRKKDLVGGNKRGLVISLPQNVVDEIRTVIGVPDANLDGELVGEVYWLFDLLSIGIHAFADKTLRERLAAIQEWLGDSFSLQPNSHFRMVPTAVGKSSKKALYRVLKQQNAEGVVFKKLDSVYKAGRPNSGGSWVKFKFTAEATVRCKYLNDKNSFTMEMMKQGNWIEVGSCTYYPSIYTPKPKDFVEVKYLYVKGEGGNLYGPPVIKGKREDVTEEDCGVAQLKYKAETPNDDGIETAEEA